MATLVPKAAEELGKAFQNASTISAFTQFLFPAGGQDPYASVISALTSARERNPSDWVALRSAINQADSRILGGLPPETNYLNYLFGAADAFRQAVDTVIHAPVQDFGVFFSTLVRELGFPDDAQTKILASEFAALTMTQLTAALKDAKMASMKADSMIKETFTQTRSSLQSPNAQVVGRIVETLLAAFQSFDGARRRFLSLQLPLHMPAAVVAAKLEGKDLESSAIRADSAVGPSNAPAASGDVSTGNSTVDNAIRAAANTVAGGAFNGLIAARFAQVSVGTAPMSGAGYKSTSTTTPRYEESGMGESFSSNTVSTGGAKESALEMRKSINSAFASAYMGMLGKQAGALMDFVKGPGEDIAAFFSEPDSRALVQAIEEIDVPSKAYIPILSGYFRTPEAAARRNRYVGQLKNLVGTIDKLTTSTYKLPSSVRNALSSLQSISKDIVVLVEESHKKIEAVFVRLASGEVTSIIADDGPLARSTETNLPEPSSTEAGEYTGEDHLRLRRAIETIRELHRRSSGANAVAAGIDRLENYLSSSKRMCEEVVKRRLDELQANYQHLLTQIVSEKERTLARKVVEFRLDTFRQFYGLLSRFEEYFGKIHKEMLLKPAMRDDLYQMMSKWTLASSSDALTTKLTDEVDELAKTVRGKIFQETDAPKGTSTVAPGKDFVPKALDESGNQTYEDWRRHIIALFSYAPQLKLFFNLVGIYEKHMGREIKVKELYDFFARFVLAISVDVCRERDILPRSSSVLFEKGPFGVNQPGAPGEDSVEGIAAVTGTVTGDDSHRAVKIDEARVTKKTTATGTALAVSLASTNSDEKKVGVYFRHMLSNVRLEDELFVRWMKALATPILLSLDNDRHTHGFKKAYIPGAEKLITGGAIDDPIGFTGSTNVIPEAVPLYIGFPIALRLYSDYFTWNGGKSILKGTDAEPQLDFQFPRTSRFYTIASVVKAHKTDADISDLQISRIVMATNEIWNHYASVKSDPSQRVSAIFDGLIEEINGLIMLQTVLGHKEAEVTQERDKYHDVMSGVRKIEDELIPVSTEKDKANNLRRGVLHALKNIALSVFSIINQINTTEDRVANDYKSYVERVQKLVTDTKDENRFEALAKAIREPSEGVGDAQSLFLSYTEFVVTPLWTLLAVVEGYTYRAANLYMMIARYLFSARFYCSKEGGGLPGNAPKKEKWSAEAAWVRFWYLYSREHATDTTVGATHSERLQRYFDSLTKGEPFGDSVIDSHAMSGANYKADVDGERRKTQGSHDAYDADAVGGDKLSMANALEGTAAGHKVKNVSNLRGLVRGNPYKGNADKLSIWRLPMHQPIYKALQLMLIPGTSFVKFSLDEVNGAPTIKMDGTNFAVFVNDSLSTIRAAVIQFLKLGEKEIGERFYSTLEGWKAQALIADVNDLVNKALGILSPNFYALREYLPNAVGAKYRDPTSEEMRDHELYPRWYVNFRRNLIKDDEVSKTILSYHETVRYIAADPYAWNSVRAESVGATIYTDDDWMKLAPATGIFSPILKYGNKYTTGSGLMPWSFNDQNVIESGWEGEPKESYVVAGPALNSAPLRAKWGDITQNDTKKSPYYPAISISENDTDALNAGCVLIPDVRSIKFANLSAADDYSVKDKPKAIAVSAGNVCKSLLYSRPAYDNKAEYLNRLLAKMATSLTINGEKPVLLYELASSIHDHPSIGQYFVSKQVPVYSEKPGVETQLTFFPGTINAPARHSDGKLVVGDRLITDRGDAIIRNPSIYRADIEALANESARYIRQFTSSNWSDPLPWVYGGTQDDAKKFLGILWSGTLATKDLQGLYDVMLPNLSTTVKRLRALSSTQTLSTTLEYSQFLLTFLQRQLAVLDRAVVNAIVMQAGKEANCVIVDSVPVPPSDENKRKSELQYGKGSYAALPGSAVSAAFGTTSKNFATAKVVDWRDSKAYKVAKAAALAVAQAANNVGGLIYNIGASRVVADYTGVTIAPGVLESYTDNTKQDPLTFEEALVNLALANAFGYSPLAYSDALVNASVKNAGSAGLQGAVDSTIAAATAAALKAAGNPSLVAAETPGSEVVAHLEALSKYKRAVDWIAEKGLTLLQKRVRDQRPITYSQWNAFAAEGRNLARTACDAIDGYNSMVRCLAYKAGATEGLAGGSKGKAVAQIDHYAGNVPELNISKTDIVGVAADGIATPKDVLSPDIVTLIDYLTNKRLNAASDPGSSEVAKAVQVIMRTGVDKLPPTVVFNTTPTSVATFGQWLEELMPAAALNYAGSILAKEDSARQELPGGIKGSGDEAPHYDTKRQPFLYSSSIVPIFWSLNSEAPKRLNDMTRGELARYVAVIPQLITAFKDLHSKISLDETLHLVGEKNERGSSSYWNLDSHTWTFGNPLSIVGGGTKHNTFGHITAGKFAFSGVEYTGESIPLRMKQFVEGMIESLSRTYKLCREKYGNPVHMELIKGDFDAYMVGGKMDIDKIITPLSAFLGLNEVGKNGPQMFAGFGEKGTPDADMPYALSWALPILHAKELGSSGVPLECVPWASRMVEKMKKVSGASLDQILQPVINQIAKLFMVQNSLVMQSMVCYSPWSSHSAAATLFHPHSIELNVASMLEGIDLVRHLTPNNAADSDHGWYWRILPTPALRPKPTGGTAPAPKAMNEMLHGSNAVFPDAIVFANPEKADELGETLSKATDQSTLKTARDTTKHLARWVVQPAPVTLAMKESLLLDYTLNPFELNSPDGRNDPLYPLDLRVTRGTEQAVKGTDLAAAKADQHSARAALQEFDKLPKTVHHDQDATIAEVLSSLFVAFKPYVEKLIAAKKIMTEETKVGNAKHTIPSHYPARDYDHNGALPKRDLQLISANKMSHKSMLKDLGYSDDGDSTTGTYFELVKISPPKNRWAQDSRELRHRAGLFLHLKRNPVSITMSTRLVPFPELYTLSEAFDLYFQLRKLRADKGLIPRDVLEARTEIGKLPVMLLTPLRPRGKIWNYSSGKLELARFCGTKTVYDAAKNGEKAAYTDPVTSVTDRTKLSSISDFYTHDSKLDNATGGVNFCSTSLNTNAGLYSYPLFAMYIRMLDQYGIELKNELSYRLKEIKYDRPDSLTEHQNALVSML